jgi:hypothetical protein
MKGLTLCRYDGLVMLARRNSIFRLRVSGVVGMVCMGWIVMLAGCGGKAISPPTPPPDLEQMLADPLPSDELNAVCRPPAGWTPKPVAQLPRSIQRVWVSPSGRTAYGVIRIHLPFPVGSDLVLWAFMNQMRQTEGEARLLGRRKDPPGLRFVAEGRDHRLRARLRTSGLSAWVVYAGTLRAQEESAAELKLAELARDVTQLDSRRGQNAENR